MADSLSARDVRFGIAHETTVGTKVDATAGFPVMNDANIKAGASWDETRRSTGVPYLTDDELRYLNHNPTFSPQTTVSAGQSGWLAALCTQKVSQSGAGPYVQLVEVDDTAKSLAHASATVAGSNMAASFWQDSGQTSGSHGIVLTGGVVQRLDFNFPESGLVTCTPTIMGTLYGDSHDPSSGVYTLPGIGNEKITNDFVCKLGPTGSPTALYSKEWSFSLICTMVPKWYGGQNQVNGLYPYRFVMTDWSVEGSFTKPIPTGSNTLSRGYVVEGGDTASFLTLYCYSSTLTDYDEATSTWDAGEMRFTMNIRLDEPDHDRSDELLERVSFKGVSDGTTPVFKMEQATTAAQSWAA